MLWQQVKTKNDVFFVFIIMNFDKIEQKSDAGTFTVQETVKRKHNPLCC